MCVLAAYNGDERAAPVLLEMLRREEGLGGGYYTGVATLHEGRLHYEKVVGDVAALGAQTAALDLPGTVGIAHSRTPSGGDREWGHPFIGVEEALAYVANGGQGLFRERVDYAEAGNRLLERGYRFRSAAPEVTPPYPVLRDGSCVHFSEVMALLIEDNLRGGADLLAAGSQACEEWPSEIVALALEANHPDHFVALRLNQPLTIGRNDHAFYAATTTLAFPEDTTWQMVMPTNSAAAVYTDCIEVVPFTRPPAVAASLPSPDEVARTLLPALGDQPRSVGELCQLTEPLWPADQMPQAAFLVYQVIAQLVAEGRAELRHDRVAGVGGRSAAPRTRVVGTYPG